MYVLHSLKVSDRNVVIWLGNELFLSLGVSARRILPAKEIDFFSDARCSVCLPAASEGQHARTVREVENCSRLCCEERHDFSDSIYRYAERKSYARPALYVINH